MKPSASLSILHVVGSLNHNWGGLSLYVAELAAELASQGHRTQIVCPPGNASEQWPAGEAEVVYAISGSKEWESALHRADLLHVHGLWLPYCHRALAAARRRNCPHLLSVHGMLEPGALQFSQWKKRLALWLYQRKDLRHATALHATASTELQTLRTFGLTQPIVTLPPGVRLPVAEPKPLPADAPRRALFLGRIHPKKGILSLIDAWAALPPHSWKLDLAGPDEAGHLAEVWRRLREKKLEQSVTYHGPVFGEAKEKLLAEASLLVVPSISENFGIVVAEGLAHGLPVITTTGTPWEVLARERCGWWVTIQGDALRAALQMAIALPPATLRAMGQRGRELTAREFGWPHLAGQMREVYAWLLGRASRPECVPLS